MAPPGLATLSSVQTSTAPEAPPTPRPTLSAVVRQVALSLLVACIIPVALFYGAFVTVGVVAAMGAALAWSYGAIAWRAFTGRRTSGLLLLTALVLTGRTVVSLLADSTFFYFFQPIISDGVVGAAFLLSLISARPIVARLAGDFYPMDHEISLRPGIRRLFRRLTAFWAALCIGKAMAMGWLLFSQPLESFVRIQSVATPTANVLAAAATIAAATLVGRREGLLAPRSADFVTVRI
jgi:hypothetical protein